MADKSFRFQLRHGDTIPENGELKTYELGYLEGTGALYMGTNVNSTPGCRRLIPPRLGDHDAYLPLTGGTINGKLTVTDTLSLGDNLSLTKSVNGGYIGLKDITNIECRVAISSSTSGKGNHGLWSSGYSSDATAENYKTSNVWIIYRDTAGKVVLPT